MRSRRTAQDQVAEVARRRLELLSAELAATRPAPVDPPSHGGGVGSGEPHVPDDPVEVEIDPASGRPGRHARRPAGPGVVLGGWVEDRLPPSLQGRVRITAAHLVVVSLAVAVAMGYLAWASVRASDPGDLVPARATTGPRPDSGALVTPVAGTSESAGAVPPAAGPPSSGGTVVVDVAGKVRRPGIVELPAGSRVVDALEEAGGARRGVDLSALNLARVLVDGEQVLVGVSPPAGVAAGVSPAPSTGSAALVNINTATQAQLESLPGVGPVTAQAILQWRTDHGAFSAVDELMEVSGIGEATLAELTPFVTI
jgi:competence protein ComEA